MTASETAVLEGLSDKIPNVREEQKVLPKIVQQLYFQCIIFMIKLVYTSLVQ
jgi:hypothetical protein